MSGIIEANKRMLLPILLFLGGPAGEAAEIGGFYNSYGVVGALDKGGGMFSELNEISEETDKYIKK